MMKKKTRRKRRGRPRKNAGKFKAHGGEEGMKC